MSLTVQVPGLGQPQKYGRVQPVKGVKDCTMFVIKKIYVANLFVCTCIVYAFFSKIIHGKSKISFL